MGPDPVGNALRRAGRPAAGGRVVEVRRGATLARGDDAGFVRRLYANGARAVIEGRIGAGCFATKGA